MAYEPLAKLLHKDRSSGRFIVNEQLARQRLEAESTFRTGFETPAGELFLAVPRELSVLSESVLRLERLVSKGMEALPPVAKGALIRHLIADEVVSSNDMEGVGSTRRQIGELLESIRQSRQAKAARRFRELAGLYLALSEDDVARPSTPSDIRQIYDQVMDGEDLSDNEPDGVLFRREGVDVIGSGGRVLHQGLTPESAINEALERMIAIAESAEIPELYAAIVAHYLFEYIHPFYDGNGRTGRFLLALYASRPLSTVTTLSLSRALSENRDAYYRSFRTAQDRLNHGELTFFVLDMLESVERAQEQTVEDLGQKAARLEEMASRLAQVALADGLREKEADCLSLLGQTALFAPYGDIGWSDIARHLDVGEQQARKYLKRLQSAGLVAAASKRPLRFELSTEGSSRLGL